MKRTIGIFAHVDAGKTTLSEAILFNGGSIRQRGSIEEKNTVMDTAVIEKDRGITCFSGAAGFSFGGDEFYLIDTPGHIDFLPDTQRCMAALDAAVICVSAVEGIEGNTELIWELLKQRNVPCVFFINKCDRDIADPDAVLLQLKKRFSPESHIWHGDAYFEAVAAQSEYLMEKYFEGSLEAADADHFAADLFAQRKLFPCINGSAVKNEGVKELLECISVLSVTKHDSCGSLVAEVFKVRREKDKRIMLCHIRKGSAAVRDALPNGEIISELRIFDSFKSSPVKQVFAGDVAEICGVYDYKAGDVIGGEKQEGCIPGLTAKVIYPQTVNSSDMLAKLKVIEDEEPTLSVKYEPATSEISVAVMGRIQLEILQQRIEERFGLNVEFGKCGVIYKETLEKASIGYGHFEPLRHYSEVHLKLEPSERGSGISFESACSLNALPSNFQNLVRTHVFEKEHLGVLTGSPLTDVKITLLTGAFHEKHTEGGDFREAVYRAIRHALMRGNSKLLEPYYYCSFTVSISDSGRVISDISKMCGTLISSETEGENAIITARIPVCEFTDYQIEFASFTGGRGRVFFRHCGYDFCHNEAEVTERIAYKAERDVENTADSVFCAHGAGFNVPWRDVENFIHLK